MYSSIALVFAASASTAWAQAAPAPPCAPLHFVYARATTEPPTNIGSGSAADFEAAASKIWSKGYGAAGYSLYTNVTKLIPGTTGYPVHYPANFDLQNSAPKGVEDMLNQLSTMSKACPRQKYVLGGHSQGGGVTTAAIPKIPADILGRVVAVTMFGSPLCLEVVKGVCRSYCNTGDNICEGGGLKGGKGMGGLPKGMSGLGAPPKSEESLPAALLKASGMRRRSKSAQEQECDANVPERGHAPGSFGTESAHTVYNKDGFYVKAAACYVAAQWKKLGRSS